ncbi:MAG: hypothetical protein LWY06_01770 [Firmicutes bacterium]|nr:hypothetical protein [Bacillota bacterium]
MNEIGQRITTTPHISTNTTLPAAKPQTDATTPPQDKVSLDNTPGQADIIAGKVIRLVAGTAFGALNVIPHAMGGALSGPEMATGFDHCYLEREPETGYLATTNLAHIVQGASIGALLGGIPGAIIGGIAEFGYALLSANQGCGPAAEAAHIATGKVENEMQDKSYRKTVGGELEGMARGAYHGAVEGFTMFLGNKD